MTTRVTRTAPVTWLERFEEILPFEVSRGTIVEILILVVAFVEVLTDEEIVLELMPLGVNDKPSLAKIEVIINGLVYVLVDLMRIEGFEASNVDEEDDDNKVKANFELCSGSVGIAVGEA